MPSYEFRCVHCHTEFSVQVPFSQKQETRCPHCGGDDLKELFGRYHFAAPGVGAPDVAKPVHHGSHQSASSSTSTSD
ncbi:MAG: zinc ribbon domain-containing protein [Limnochordaceae bacterium]|nr:zinc ribbon domain-containing protein [Limnochordaceae bacterium]